VFVKEDKVMCDKIMVLIDEDVFDRLMELSAVSAGDAGEVIRCLVDAHGAEFRQAQADLLRGVSKRDAERTTASMSGNAPRETIA
jgi:hypothetical protein